MRTSLTRSFVEALWSISWDTAPEPARQATRTLLLDHLGVVIAGAATDSAGAMRAHLGHWPTAVGAARPMLGSGAQASGLDAAMANAVAGHSVELDDVHCPASLHPGVVVFPAAFAAHAMLPVLEPTFLTAVLRGYEAMCRIGRAINPAAHYARHFHPTATTGCFAAAVVAASILDLDEAAATAALGVAASLASGSMAFLADGAWTKRLHPAFAVRNGIESAVLAADGVLAPTDGIAGDAGFLYAYSSDPNPSELLKEFGARALEVAVTSIKPHACCRYMQGPIDAVLAIRNAEGIDTAEVDRVRLGIPTVARDIVAEPAEAKRRPANVVDAQFSLPFGAAVALTHGSAGLSQFEERTLRSEPIRQLMQRVEHVVDPAIDAVFPERWLAWAEITTRSGEVLRREISAPKGDPLNPVTTNELIAKFTELVAPTLSDDTAAAVIDAVDAVHTQGGLDRLDKALLGAGGSSEGPGL